MAKLAAELEGNRMNDLASMGRFGDTMVAHINPQEAQMLMEEGGAGTINPMTGLPEFYDFDDAGADYDYSADAASVDAAGDTGDAGGGGDLGFDYDLEDAAEIVIGEKFGDEFSDGGQAGPMSPLPDATPEEQEAFYGLAPGTLGPQGVGRGGPAEFEGGPGDRASTTATFRDILNKQGMTREQAVYFNALKDRGLSNEDAIAALAAALGTPGGAAALSAGYRDGYKYGGPMGTLADVFDRSMTSMAARAADARTQAAKERSDSDDFLESEDYLEEPGFLDKFADMLGLDKLSLNPLSTTLTPAQQAIKDSLSAQGLIVQGRGTLDKALGFIGSAMLPTTLGAGKFLAENVTNTGIFATAIDPVTGFQYLVDNSGGLQLAPGELGDPSDIDAGGGDEPTITKKRKAVTEPKEEEEKEEEEDKPYFPKARLPRLTESGLKSLQYAYRNDPEILENIYNRYALPEQYSGLKALV